MKCYVYNCKSSNEGKASEISFFRFPKDPKLKKQWIKFSRCEKNVGASASVCLLHFKPEDIANRLQYEMGFASCRILKQGAVPTVHVDDIELDTERALRTQKRENKRIVEEILEANKAEPLETTLAYDEYVQAADDAYDVKAEPWDDPLANEPAVDGVHVVNEALLDDPLTNEEHVPAADEAQNVADERTESNLETEDMSTKNSTIAAMMIRKENQIKQLTEKNAILKDELKKAKRAHTLEVDTLQKQLAKATNELDNLETKLSILFSKSQIEKLKSGLATSSFSEEDIAQSMTLHAASANFYKILYRKNFPLPSVNTLQKWTQALEINRGILQPVFQVLSAYTHMNEMQKICVLSFNEMKMKTSYSYDTATDTTLAPVGYVQVAMLRGLTAKWNQPIFYEFDCQLTKDLLFRILEKVKSSGFTVVAIVTTLGRKNRALLDELKVTDDAPWFLFRDEKIFSFADVPQLMQLLRKYFLDDGFLLDDKVVRKDIILKILNSTSHELGMVNKITTGNLTMTDAKRHNAKLAIKLFSHTIAEAINKAAALGLLNDFNWKECHQIFQLTNDWFDIMNVRFPRTDAVSSLQAYGLAVEEQNQILDQMTEMMKNIRTVKNNQLLSFQKGIIRSNNALKALHEDLKSRYGIIGILTYRLNLDRHEKFFDFIRSKDGSGDDPGQEEFSFGLKSYILGRNDRGISHSANAELEETHERTEKSLTGLIFSKIPFEIENKAINNDNDDFSDLADGDLDLENLAAYISNKLKGYVPNNITINIEPITSSSATWVDHLTDGELPRPTDGMMPYSILHSILDPTYSITWANVVDDGGLSKPTDENESSKPIEEMINHIKALNEIFESINRKSLLVGKGFLKRHLRQSKSIQCSEEVKELFFRARMFLHIKKLNSDILEISKQRKRKWSDTAN